MTSLQVDQFLTDARIGRLGMATPDGEPYVIPLPFCWHLGSIYVRLPMKGRKGEILAKNQRVCFEVDWFSDTLDDYGSVLVEGRIEAVNDLSEKRSVKDVNDAKYARLRQGFRPGHGRQTRLEDLPMWKIAATRLSGRRRDEPAAV